MPSCVCLGMSVCAWGKGERVYVCAWVGVCLFLIGSGGGEGGQEVGRICLSGIGLSNSVGGGEGSHLFLIHVPLCAGNSNQTGIN